jgi:hypothetical protein
MQLLKSFPSKLISGALLALLSFHATASIEAATSLRARYQSLLPALENNVFDAPLHIESEDSQGRIRGAVFGVVYHSLDDLRAMVTSPPEWCELLLIHPNIKYCTHRGSSSEDIVLTIYAGSKNYTPVADTRRSEYRVRVKETARDYLVANVSADTGPLDTSDYRLVLEAVPIDGDSTFVHVGFSYRYGPMTRALTATYFSTLGRNKIGFSVVGRDRQGQPVFVRGRTASLERTVMRTYLALQTWLEGRGKPDTDRVEWRLRRWYFLTERYPRQLYEFDEKDYLDVKRRERANGLPAQGEASPAKG